MWTLSKAHIYNIIHFVSLTTISGANIDGTTFESEFYFTIIDFKKIILLPFYCNVSKFMYKWHVPAWWMFRCVFKFTRNWNSFFLHYLYTNGFIPLCINIWSLRWHLSWNADDLAEFRCSNAMRFSTTWSILRARCLLEDVEYNSKEVIRCAFYSK